jgi:hypothetical protein
VNERLFKIQWDADVFEKADAAPGRERRIGGFVSTDHLDKQHERLIQEGMDFQPFLKGGFFNDNHLKETGKAVGYPETCELRSRPDGSKGWYVEGFLLKGHPPADEIWSLAQALKRSGAPRTLGYSVEGTVVERDANDHRKISKAVVREVAVTRCPVNDHTSLTMLAKSLAVGNDSPTTTAPGNAAVLSTVGLEGVNASRPEPLVKKRKKPITKSEAAALIAKRAPHLSKSIVARIAGYAVKHHPARAA